MGDRENILMGRWVHSSEEDTEDIQVFRPSGYPLPPARGRAQMAFSPDRTMKSAGIGPTDISRVTDGTWTGELEKGEAIELTLAPGEAPQKAELTDDADGPVLKVQRKR